MATLYELADEFEQFYDEVTSSDEGLSDEQLQKLEEIGESFDKKVAACAKVFLSMEHQAKGIKEAADRMRKRADVMNKKAKALRKYVIDCMLRMSQDHVDVDGVRVTRVTTKGSVVVNDLDALPNRYIVRPPVEPKPDKAAIAEAIRDGRLDPESCGVTIEKKDTLRIG